MTDDLPLDFLAGLLKDVENHTSKWPIPEQHGPLRYYDKEMRCASKGCGSPTHYKLEGIQYCTVHCLRLMNTMLYERENGNSSTT